MVFIELKNFEKASNATNHFLQAQLKNNSDKKTRWIEWSNELEILAPIPDVCLVYATNENWRSVKKIIDKSSAKFFVLYGCAKSLLALPTLSDISDIDEILNFMQMKSCAPTFITTEPPPWIHGRAQIWQETMPIQTIY